MMKNNTSYFFMSFCFCLLSILLQTKNAISITLLIDEVDLLLANADKGWILMLWDSWITNV